MNRSRGTFQIINRYVPPALWQTDPVMEYENPKIIPCPGVNDVPFAVVYMAVLVHQLRYKVQNRVLESILRFCDDSFLENFTIA